MEKIFGLIGIFGIVGLVYLFSPNKSKVNWKSVGLAFIMQIVLAGALILTPLWKVVEFSSSIVSNLLAYANEGISFVFGDLFGGWSLFLGGLMPIVFLSALTGLAFHFGILQKFVKIIGLTVAKLFKVDPIVAVNGVSNMFLGQSDSLFITRNYLPKASESVIFATLVGGMTSISVSVVGVYTGLGASMEWILVSMPLTVFSCFVLTQLYMPTEYVDANTLEITSEGKGDNFLETMVNYGRTGFDAVVGITIALLVFISFVAFVNGILGALFPALTLQKILGVVFYPLALLMGVPSGEVGVVSQILASKFVLNEAVAFGLPQFATLSANAKAMVTIANCGFAGIGSIGILIGAYTSIAPNKVKTVVKLGFKALLIATLVNIMSGAVIGLFL